MGRKKKQKDVKVEQEQPVEPIREQTQPVIPEQI
jgi:hypothetical protein